MCLLKKFSKIQEKQLNRTLFDYSKRYRLTMNDIIKSPTKMKTFSISAIQIPSSKLARQTDFCLIGSSAISDAHRARAAENEFHQVEEVYRRRRASSRKFREVFPCLSLFPFEPRNCRGTHPIRKVSRPRIHRRAAKVSTGIS